MSCNLNRSLRWPLTLTVILFALSLASSAQSSDSPPLGDLARKQREKQSKTAKPKKVVTNEEIPESPNANSSDSGRGDGPHDEVSIHNPAGDVLKTGDAYKAQIAQRKAALAELKNQMDKLNDSIHFVEANAYRNGVEYNKRQAQKQQEVERLKGQYEEQKRDLEQMQESARKAGFGSAVWDP
jgi:predicted RNase H-like nuclease (RuvC/YqgF family)